MQDVATKPMEVLNKQTSAIVEVIIVHNSANLKQLNSSKCFLFRLYVLFKPIKASFEGASLDSEFLLSNSMKWGFAVRWHSG